MVYHVFICVYMFLICFIFVRAAGACGWCTRAPCDEKKSLTCSRAIKRTRVFAPMMCHITSLTHKVGVVVGKGATRSAREAHGCGETGEMVRAEVRSSTCVTTRAHRTPIKVIYRSRDATIADRSPLKWCFRLRSLRVEPVDIGVRLAAVCGSDGDIIYFLFENRIEF